MPALTVFALSIAGVSIFVIGIAIGFTFGTQTKCGGE